MYKNLLYHIVFSTKYREETITIEHETILYKFIWKFAQENKSVLYRVGGMPNHVHILIDIHPTIAISDFLRDLKSTSSGFLKKFEKEFPKFIGWGKTYGIFSYSSKEKETIINYIKNQKTHHTSETYEDELRRLLIENGVEINEEYFLKDDEPQA